jgi:hypothetical protein
MLFGIANTLASFQNMINEIFKDMIDLSIITYIDDILIYSQTKKEHMRSFQRDTQLPLEVELSYVNRQM